MFKISGCCIRALASQGKKRKKKWTGWPHLPHSFCLSARCRQTKKKDPPLPHTPLHKFESLSLVFGNLPHCVLEPEKDIFPRKGEEPSSKLRLAGCIHGVRGSITQIIKSVHAQYTKCLKAALRSVCVRGPSGSGPLRSHCSD